MSSGNERPGSNTPRRLSPELAQRERRRAFWAGILGLGMGLIILGESVNAMRTGHPIALGRLGDELILPGWAGALISVFLLFVSGSILWRFARKT